MLFELRNHWVDRAAGVYVMAISRSPIPYATVEPPPFKAEFSNRRSRR